MPYRVSAKDPEVLLVTAGTSSCDCRWYLELDWSSQGRTGTVRIDDDGRPFRTSAIEGLPRYTYDTLERRWGPYV
ncbi:Helix-turn-helix domain-containing protein OS=Streptomyces tendae OX=1932 GN=GUR47_06805 PE=4 SV=1 [Streptomyces tendae]